VRQAGLRSRAAAASGQSRRRDRPAAPRPVDPPPVDVPSNRPAPPPAPSPGRCSLSTPPPRTGVLLSPSRRTAGLLALPLRLAATMFGEASARHCTGHHPLRLCQFNVLAPSARICMPLDAIPWLERHTRITDCIRSLAPAVVCLQEYDFATPGFTDLYQARLGDAYDIYTQKRTGRKVDGLALLVRRRPTPRLSCCPPGC
jgi:hypothetical protein